jgi:hypothetical protein
VTYPDHGELFTRYIMNDQEAAEAVEEMAGMERDRREREERRRHQPPVCAVCWTSHGCHLGRGHLAALGHICLLPSEHFPDGQDGSVVFYDVCSRSPVGAPGNFMADYSDRSTLFEPEVINDQDGDGS